jgi:hypothetical protein
VLVKPTTLHGALLLACPMTLLSVMLFYPGFMSIDSLNQLSQARSGIYGDVQPAAMSIIWRYLDFYVRGPIGFLMLQNLIFWAALILSLSFFESRLFYLLVILVGIFPPYFLLEGVIWKDVLMNDLLLLSFGIIVAGVASDKTGRAWQRSALSLSASFGALLMRHNAILAVVPLVYLALASQSGKEAPLSWATRFRFSLLSAVSAAVMLVGASTITYRMASQHHPISQIVAAFDLVGIASAKNAPIYDPAVSPKLANIFMNESALDPDAVRLRYNPCDAFPIFASHAWGKAMATISPDTQSVDDLWSLWRHEVKTNVKLYLVHRWNVFKCSLGIGGMGPWYAPFFFYASPEAEGLGLKYDRLSDVQKLLADKADYLSRTVVYMVFPYFILAGVIAALGVTGSRPLDELAAALAVSGILYQVGYALIGVTTEFRYYSWTILSSVVAAIIYLLPRISSWTIQSGPDRLQPSLGRGDVDGLCTDSRRASYREAR